MRLRLMPLFVTNHNAAPLYYMIKNLNKSMCEKPRGI